MAKVYGDRPPQKYRVRLLPAMRCERLLPMKRIMIVDHLQPVRHPGHHRDQSGPPKIVIPRPQPMN